MTLGRWWSALLSAVICCGCIGGGGNIAYYTLHAANEGPQALESRKTSPLVIGLGPVALPEYLDRAAVVTRMGPNRLKVNDGHRWAGSLQSEILRELAVHLERLVPVKEVAVFPWDTRIEPDLRFRVQIQTFEGRLGGQVALRAAWSLTPGQSDQPAVRRVTVIQEDVKGRSFEDLVAAMGSALAHLSAEMANAVSMATAGSALSY